MNVHYVHFAKGKILFQNFGLTSTNWTLKRFKLFIAKCIKCQFKELCLVLVAVCLSVKNLPFVENDLSLYINLLLCKIYISTHPKTQFLL